jgi:hypothetical protein
MTDRNEATDDAGTPSGTALFRQVHAGCRDSLARLMKVHGVLVHTVERLQVLGDLPLAEALQAGRIEFGVRSGWPSVPRVRRQDTSLSAGQYPTLVKMSSPDFMTIGKGVFHRHVNIGDEPSPP